MTVVVDTSVLIDHLRGSQQAHDALRLAADAGDKLMASVLTRVEVLAGMRQPETETTLRLLNSLEWAQVDERVADRAGWLANRYLRSHPGVDPVDYVIAATVVQHGAVLWTGNLKHFPMFPELRSPY